MSLLYSKLKSLFSVFLCAVFILFMCSCSSDKNTLDKDIDNGGRVINDTEEAFYISNMPSADGKKVYGNSDAIIDASNISDGYVMVAYKGESDKKLKILVNAPGGESCNYDLSNDGKYEIISFVYGSGNYNVGVYENISGNQYSTVFATDLDVQIKNKFMPFLLPNAYVGFNKDSEALKVAKDITAKDESQLDMIETIYNYVTKNISYDYDMADKAAKGELSGYIPDIDKVLKRGKGICFDYAVLMTSMLRSQNIPSKLIIGYAGEVYHAWINVYSKETGEIDKVIKFAGDTYVLMDPTFSSSYNDEEELQEYIGDGTNYQEKYVY